MLGGRRHEAGSTTDTGWVLIEDTQHHTTLLMGIEQIKYSGRVLSKSGGSRGSRGRFSVGQDGQKWVKTTKNEDRH